MSLVSHVSVRQRMSKLFFIAKQLAKFKRLFRPSKLLTLKIRTLIRELIYTIELFLFLLVSLSTHICVSAAATCVYVF